MVDWSKLARVLVEEIPTNFFYQGIKPNTAERPLEFSDRLVEFGLI